MISIAIIEDIEEIRNSLVEYFTITDNLLCEIATESVESFFEFADKNKDITPDILLLDIDLPGISGISGMPMIKERFPNIDIIMLTVYEDNDKIFRSLQAGATGYLLKTTPFDKISAAIEELNSGGSPMSPTIARKVIQYFSPQKVSVNKNNLTTKEKEIVHYLVDGKSYAQIAESLGNSIETIRHHIKNIYKKMHVKSKAELISKELSR